MKTKFLEKIKLNSYYQPIENDYLILHDGSLNKNGWRIYDKDVLKKALDDYRKYLEPVNNNKKKTKQVFSEIDPYGEEDWDEM